MRALPRWPNVAGLMWLLTALACGSSADHHADAGVGEGFLIGPSGGRFDFGEGITLDVPAGALETPAWVWLAPIDAVGAARVLASGGFTDKRLLGGVHASSSTVFDAPVELTLPVADLTGPTSLPVPIAVDFEASTADVLPIDIRLEPDAGRIIVRLQRLGPTAIAEILDVRSASGLREAATRAAITTSAKACVELESCRCMGFDVREEHRDGVAARGECVLSRIAGSITYPACGTATESWVFQEVNGSCVPKLTLEAPAGMGVSTTQPLSVSVLYVNVPIEGLAVQLSAGGGLTLGSDNLTTDSEGRAETQLVAPDEEALGFVRAVADVTYFTRLVAANGSTFESESHTVRLTRHALVNVVRAPMLVLPARPFHLYPGIEDELTVAVVDPTSLELVGGVPVTLRATGALEFAVGGRETSVLSGTMSPRVPTMPGPVPGPYSVTATADVPYTAGGRRLLSHQEVTITGEVRPPERWSFECSVAWQDATWSEPSCSTLCLDLDYSAQYSIVGELRAFDAACLDITTRWAETHPTVPPMNHSCGEATVRFDSLALVDGPEPDTTCTASEPAIGPESQLGVLGFMTPVPVRPGSGPRTVLSSAVHLTQPTPCTTDVACTTCYGGACEIDTESAVECSVPASVGVALSAQTVTFASDARTFSYGYSGLVNANEDDYVTTSCTFTKTSG